MAASRETLAVAREKRLALEVKTERG